jgi:hypothetical protein
MVIGCRTKINVMEQGQPGRDLSPSGMEKLLGKVRRQLMLVDYLLMQPAAGRGKNSQPGEIPGEKGGGPETGPLPA